MVRLQGKAEGGAVGAAIEAEANSAVHILLLLLEVASARVHGRRDRRGHEELLGGDLLAEHLQTR